MTYFDITFATLCCLNAVMFCLGVPSADTAWQVNALKSTFSKTRNHQVNNNGKQEARSFIKNHFRSLGMTVVSQTFTTERNDVTGENIVGILRGTNYGESSDTFYGIAAHYDTMPDTPGVDDNGSGVVAMLEAARILKQTGPHTNTLVFIAFDFEEWYTGSGTACTRLSCGSTYFVNHWPSEMQDSLPVTQFGGVIVMDTIMNYQNSSSSQILPRGFQQVFPGAFGSIQSDQFEGDFLVMIARSYDSVIASPFVASWKSLGNNDLEIEALSLPVSNPPTAVEVMIFGDFLRSDHAEFWSRKLPAIFISDTADLRGYMEQCYHHSCDDISRIDEDNILFLGKVTDSLVQTMLKLSPTDMSFTST